MICYCMILHTLFYSYYTIYKYFFYNNKRETLYKKFFSYYCITKKMRLIQQWSVDYIEKMTFFLDFLKKLKHEKSKCPINRNKHHALGPYIGPQMDHQEFYLPLLLLYFYSSTLWDLVQLFLKYGPKIPHHSHEF